MQGNGGADAQADADEAPKSKAKATKKSAAPASAPEDKAPADDGGLMGRNTAFRGRLLTCRPALQ